MGQNSASDQSSFIKSLETKESAEAVQFIKSALSESPNPETYKLVGDALMTFATDDPTGHKPRLVRYFETALSCARATGKEDLKNELLQSALYRSVWVKNAWWVFSR